MVAFGMLAKFWTWVAWAFAMTVAWFGGLHQAFWALLILQGLDVTTGVMVAMRTKTFRSAIGKAGIQKRIAAWVLIGAIATMQHYVGILPPPPEAGDMGIAEWAAVGMAFMEFTSIVENAGRLGVALPSWLLTAMDKAKTLLGLEPREPGEGGK